MVDFSEANFSSNSTTNFSNDAFSLTVPKQVSYIATIAINSITCPFTVLLNVLVIMAAKRRRRLRSKTNILLACLAVTDLLTGLVAQPSFIVWKTFQLLGKTPGMAYHDSPREVHNSSFRALTVCSSLHLMLVTCERLIAIRFTMHYPYIVIKRNIKVAVIAIWIFVIFCDVFRRLKTDLKIAFNLLVGLVLVSCILFILVSYVILYRETLCQQTKIKTQQLPQEEVQRFAKERKALKTTVLVVGTVMLCFLPMLFALFISVSARSGQYQIAYIPPYVRTFSMLNSLLNPLIYCWRQKEMRQFVFRLLPQVVAPKN